MIPAIIGGHIINNTERVMLSLLTHLGCLGLKIFSETVENEYIDLTRIATTMRARLEVKSKLNGKKVIKKMATDPGNIR